jgi:hypothetical protein
MKPQLTTRRRFLLFGVLPVSLLMIAVPLFPHVAPQINESMLSLNNRQVAAAAPASLAASKFVYDENAPRISPSVEPGLRQGRRMVALDVITRLEEEARRQGGNTRLSPLDLKRLRNALREAESHPIAGRNDIQLSADRTDISSDLIPSAAVISPAQ